LLLFSTKIISYVPRIRAKITVPIPHFSVGRCRPLTAVRIARGQTLFKWLSSLYGLSKTFTALRPLTFLGTKTGSLIYSRSIGATINVNGFGTSTNFAPM
jgi:hypothetical protein